MFRTLAAGFAASLTMGLLAFAAYHGAVAVVQPDRWPDRGLGWLAVVALAVAGIAFAFALGLRAYRRAEHARYLRANRRDDRGRY